MANERIDTLFRSKLDKVDIENIFKQSSDLKSKLKNINNNNNTNDSNVINNINNESSSNIKNLNRDNNTKVNDNTKYKEIFDVMNNLQKELAEYIDQNKHNIKKLQNEINEKCHITALEDLEYTLGKEIKDLSSQTNDKLRRKANQEWVNMMLKKLDELPKNEIKKEDTLFTKLKLNTLCASCNQPVKNLTGKEAEYIDYNKFPHRINHFGSGFSKKLKELTESIDLSHNQNDDSLIDKLSRVSYSVTPRLTNSNKDKVIYESTNEKGTFTMKLGKTNYKNKNTPTLPILKSNERSTENYKN